MCQIKPLRKVASALLTTALVVGCFVTVAVATGRLEFHKVKKVAKETGQGVKSAATDVALATKDIATDVAVATKDTVGEKAVQVGNKIQVRPAALHDGLAPGCVLLLARCAHRDGLHSACWSRAHRLARRDGVPLTFTRRKTPQTSKTETHVQTKTEDARQVTVKKIDDVREDSDVLPTPKSRKFLGIF